MKVGEYPSKPVKDYMPGIGIRVKTVIGTYTVEFTCAKCGRRTIREYPDLDSVVCEVCFSCEDKPP